MHKYMSEDNNSTKLNKRQLIFTGLICFLFLYAMFAPDRLKYILSIKIEGMPTTNLLLILPLVYLILFLFKPKQEPLLKNKNSNLLFWILLYMYIMIITIGGFNSVSIEQYLYASLMFIMPIFLFFYLSYCSKNEMLFLLKIIVFTSLIYSILAILLSTNLYSILSFLGNPAADQYKGYTQYRAPMMLGSSITVSYYFNLSLPISYYMFFKIKDKKWKLISGLSIVMNLIATFVFLSRTATLCAILITVFSLLFMNNRKRKIGVKISTVLILIIGGIYTLSNFDLSRLALGFDTSESSISLRLLSAQLGLYIFSKFPFLGSGMGRFYERIYTDSILYIDGFSGLIDPHNMYVLILSEMGIIGLLVTILLFLFIFIRLLQIKDKDLRLTSYLVLLSFLIGAMGGSHLFISLNFAVVFWIYIGLLCNIRKIEN